MTEKIFSFIPGILKTGASGMIIWVEAQNSEPINDAVYKRNNIIEQTHDIEISISHEDAAKTGDDLWEVIITPGHDIPWLEAKMLYNLMIFLMLTSPLHGGTKMQ